MIMVNMLDYGIWGNLDLSSQAMVVHVWLQNELIPLELRVVILC